MTGDLLLLGFVFLAAGVLAVPVATRLGLGSVLGYLIAGIALAPLLGALRVDVAAIQHIAEVGVVMMLFLVGLEVEPRVLWQMRTKLVGLGGLQVVLSTAALAGAGMLLGLTWQAALTAGMVLTVSSTAIVLQTLNEKGLTRSDGGAASFAILLFQDIAVIAMLALIPLLATADLAGHGAGAHGDDAGPSLVAGLAGWQAGLVTAAAIAAMIGAGQYLTRPIFRFVAAAGLRELFTATALLFVVGIALLMSLVGLSAALGTFLAGVVLANSEYRHELESDIDPFRGLLLGLFFMTVGASVDFSLLAAELGPVLGLTLGLMAIKGAVLLALALLFGIRGGDRWLMTLGLAHAGEFAFVLLSFAVANGAMAEPLADRLLLAVALSMLLTPPLFILHERAILPRYAGAAAPEPDAIEPTGAVIIAGHGRFGGIVNRMLREAGYETTVLDHSAAQLEMMRTFGIRAFYGDATRPDLLEAAGIARARMLVIAIDDPARALTLAKYVKQTYPQVHIVARARGRHDVYALYAAGVEDIVRETFDSGVRAGRSAFEALGLHPIDAERMARHFVANDRRALRELAGLFDPAVPAHRNPAYVARSKALMAEREAQLRGARTAHSARVERAWSPPSRADVAAAEAAEREG